MQDKLKILIWGTGMDYSLDLIHMMLQKSHRGGVRDCRHNL